MADNDTASWIAALERARSELESALAGDEHWLALRGSAGGADRSAHERALAGNSVYHCWEQLNGVIEELRSSAQTEPKPQRRRVELRHILEHIRGDATLQAGEVPALSPTAGMAERPTPPAPSDGAISRSPPVGLPPLADGGLEPEEAAVSFVIREPARRVPVGGNKGAAPGPKGSTPSEAADPAAEPGVEAEVTIVPQQR